jgi:hypothetical protein
MEMPTPTEAHRRLEKLVGRWSGEEKMTPMPFDPEGGVAIGRVDNRVALDGFAVVQDYEQERGGAITYRALGVYRWDADKDEYVLYWYDSMGGPPSEYLRFQSGRRRSQRDRPLLLPGGCLARRREVGDFHKRVLHAG